MENKTLLGRKLINSPNLDGDGITLCDGEHYYIQDVIVDLSDWNTDEIDEAIGITWGCSAVISNCIFTGAGKLVLCGSNDPDKADVEKGKEVIFNNCVFEHFGRRGPEVQCGMKVQLNDCFILDWGSDDRFDTRNFGAWVHGEGSELTAVNCIFGQHSLGRGKHWFKDWYNHLGQAINDEGILSIFKKRSWVSGRRRALTASNGGIARAINCYKSSDELIIDGLESEMSEMEFSRRMLQFTQTFM